MQLEEKKSGNVLVINILEARMDARVAADFKSRMFNLINSGNTFIVLNFSEVDFIDSSGLGAIVSVLKTIGKNGDIVLSGINDTVMTMFRLTRMDKVFDIYSSESEAVTELSKKI
ncbi:MAG: anti-sigma factor antagonist [Calditrichaeota bacterium]|nr:MAG: anti-sigma factor antagonist [Calditrichota bacterium]